MKNKIEIPQIVKDIAKVLIDNGNQAFVVGGAVRDAVMDVECKDIDIATDLFVDDVILLFKDLKMTKEIKLTGDKFPVARIFTTCGEEFEIATFRSDIGEGKDTGFKIETSINGDVARRDFTFNALFANALTGEIVDLVGGIDDLDNKIIRFVGDPIQRINEDRTRLLRLVRFSERFGFTIADFDLIKSNNILIRNLEEKDKVKKEMIVTEITKGFEQAKDKVSFFKTLSKLELFQQSFPSLDICNPFISFDSIELMLVQCFCLNFNEDVLQVMKEMKWSNDCIDRVNIILRFAEMDIEKSDFDIPDLSRFIKKIKSSGLREILDDSAISILFGTKGEKFVKSLLGFELTVKNTDFSNIPNGPELGKAIHDKEIKNLKKLL